MAFQIESGSTHTCIGLMSGTSLDGLDICLCTFHKKEDGTWRYSIIKATTLPYPKVIRELLESAPRLNGEQLTELDYKYGHWLGKITKEFIQETKENPSFIASHGHTIFHNPKNGYTLQIGKGSAISTETGIPCISDFRSSDVCKSGQGAPLVPIGDKLLFSEYDICLNLGGIANLSFDNNNSERIAYDVSPCNMMLNYLSNQAGKECDFNGELGKQGKVCNNLLEKFNDLEYYKTDFPKSLGREWFELNVMPIINSSHIKLDDKLRTSYEHIANQITSTTNKIEGKNLLITGGGAKNMFLIDLIRQKSNKEVIIPDSQTIDFKEALIFAFLGVLFTEQQHSALATVTGARTNSISGCFYY